MKLDELNKNLNANDARMDTINILSAPKDYAMNLCRDGTEFSVFYMEKGMKTQLGKFASFEEAADVFWSSIQGDRYFFM